MIVEYVCVLLSALRLNAIRRRYAERWQERAAQEKAAEQTRRNRYAAWPCPECGRKFGPKVQYVNYARDEIIIAARGPFVRHVIITCQFCKLLNIYDPAGGPLFHRGELTDGRRALWNESEELSLS